MEKIKWNSINKKQNVLEQLKKLNSNECIKVLSNKKLHQSRLKPGTIAHEIKFLIKLHSLPQSFISEWLKIPKTIISG